jgi:hypothetical protein
VCTPLHFQSIAHPGACRKTRVVPHNRRPRPRTYGNGEPRNACAVVGVRGRGGASNRWWRSRCSCAFSARRYGCARHRTARSGWPRSGCRWCRSAHRYARWCTGRRWRRRCCCTRSAGNGHRCTREPCGIVEPGSSTREQASPGEVNRQRPRGHVRRSVARHGHQIPHASPGALLRAMAATDPRSELMP